MTWFYENYIVLRVGKCYFLTVSFNESFPGFLFNDTTIEILPRKRFLEKG